MFKSVGAYIHQAHARTHAACGENFAGELNSSGNVYGLVVQKNSVHAFAIGSRDSP